MEGLGSVKILVVLLLLACASASILRDLRFNLADDSCEGRCNQGLDPGAPCQCNTACERFGDCCADYEELCKPGEVPDKELEDLAEELIRMDTENNATQFITVNLQGRTTSGCGADVAPEPLLTVQSEAWSRSTIAKLVALHDNYNAEVRTPERYTPEHEREIEEFTEAIFNTPIMIKAQEFLAAKKLPSGRENFYTLWFQLYNRGGTTNSSSGFEHVFLGELNNGVSGFHNWEAFAKQEEEELMDYKGYMDFIDFGDLGSVIEHRFEWRDQCKSITSMFIGTSPEFELALYTVCFHARKDKKCPISLNGNKIQVQTYTLTSSAGVHVGTAYPDLSN